MDPDPALLNSVPSIFGRFVQMVQGPRWAPIPRPGVVTEHFEKVWANYPEPYKSLIDLARQKKAISIVLDEAFIPASVVIAGHLGGVFYFRWKRISLEQLDTVIVHEIAHYYIDARDGHEWTDYQFSARHAAPERAGRAKQLLVDAEAEAALIEIDVLQKFGLACRSAKEEILDIIQSAQASLLLITTGHAQVHALEDSLTAAARRGVQVRVVLGDAGTSANGSLAPVLRALSDEVALHLWPSTQEPGLGPLFFECAARDARRAFVAPAQPPALAGIHRIPPGMLITGDDASTLQRHFEQTIDREFLRLRAQPAS